MGDDFQMTRKVWEGLGLFAALVASAGAAGAADLAVKAPVYKAPPVILSDWSGFYLGVHGGYGSGDMSFDSPFAELSGKPKGGVFGGHAGYNWQYGQVVTGLEVDYSAADLSSSGVIGSTVNGDGFGHTFSRDLKVDQLASARARVGYTVLPSLLAYGTAGLGWGHAEVTGTETDFRRNVATGSFSESAAASSFGWVAGAGLEYKVWGNFIARAEYLHYDLGKSTYSFPSFSTGASTTVDAVRGGVSYKF
jgi:opacity protein-like surface antigen